MDDAYDDEGRVESGSRTGEVWADGGHRNGFFGVFVAVKGGAGRLRIAHFQVLVGITLLLVFITGSI